MEIPPAGISAAVHQDSPLAASSVVGASRCVSASWCGLGSGCVPECSVMQHFRVNAMLHGSRQHTDQGQGCRRGKAGCQNTPRAPRNICFAPLPSGRLLPALFLPPTPWALCFWHVSFRATWQHCRGPHTTALPSEEGLVLWAHSRGSGHLSHTLAICTFCSTLRTRHRFHLPL